MRKVEAELSEGYEIRFAGEADIPDIMTFFKNHWKDTHILANDRAFFEYEFCRGGEVCFVLLFNRDREIEGTLGYIPYGDDNRDIFIVMWKVINNGQLFAGVGLLNYLIENGRCRHIYTSGLNEGTRNIYRYMGFQTGKLSHFYMLNPACEYKIALIEDETEINFNTPDGSVETELKEIKGEKEFLEFYIPEKREDKIAKSAEYMVHRYFRNPKYKYGIYQLSKQGNLTSSFLIVRRQQANDSNILRIIDFVGDESLLQYVGVPLRNMMDGMNYEYIDMYEFGIDDNVLLKAGFTKKEENSKNIIPDYFSPFVRKNIDINIFWEKETNPIILKGDGDQDRPSV